MDLELYNTLTRSLTTLPSPQDKREVSIYACGPTPYDRAHIGNLRTYVFNDILRRVLIWNGYKPKYVMNITDVDDKTIAGSQKAGQSLPEYTSFFEQLFWQDTDALNITRPTLVTHATDYIPQMVGLVQKLLDKKIAYVAEDGVYFDISKFAPYGALAGRAVGDTTHTENFALWKFYKPEDGSTRWEAPFGAGRPGWHLECSAMIEATFGNTVDIHTGGSDLIFPHHQNEIAQSESATGRPLAHIWMHGGFVNVSDEKMSKSLQNFVTLQDIIARGYDPLAYRLLLLMTHYRKPINFTWEALDGAQALLNRLRTRVASLSEDGQVDENLKKEFAKSLNGDLNTARALATLNVETDVITRATWLEFDKIFGLGLDRLEKIEVPEEVAKLVAEREQARASKNFSESDRLRDEIKKFGFEVKDTADGPVITR